MQTQGRTELKKMRAVEALKAVLTHASGVKLRNIDAEPSKASSDIDIVAQIEVYGHNHTLACMLLPNDAPKPVRDSVAGFYDRAVKVAKNATPVLITQHLSSDLQKLCRDTCVGVLDLKGNARLELGEIFIACQQMACHQKSHRKVSPKLSDARSAGASVHNDAVA
jgi:hypothetical protein